KDEMRRVQNDVLSDNLRWMDVQLALATQDEPIDNAVVDGFNTVEEKVDGFTEANQSFLGTSNKEEHPFKYLTGKKINKKQAGKIGKEMLQIKQVNGIDVNITKSSDGANIPTYSVAYEKDDKTGYMDISEKGGHPLSMIINREVNDKEISLNEGLEKAKAYLDEQEFDQMTIFQS